MYVHVQCTHVYVGVSLCIFKPNIHVHVLYHVYIVYLSMFKPSTYHINVADSVADCERRVHDLLCGLPNYQITMDKILAEYEKKYGRKLSYYGHGKLTSLLESFHSTVIVRMLFLHGVPVCMYAVCSVMCTVACLQSCVVRKLTVYVPYGMPWFHPSIDYMYSVYLCSVYLLAPGPTCTYMYMYMYIYTYTCIHYTCMYAHTCTYSNIYTMYMYMYIRCYLSLCMLSSLT